MVSTAAPSDEQVTTFLRALRQYRGPLEGPDQRLLDTMVFAALTPAPDHPLPDEVQGLWAAYAGISHSRGGGLDLADGTASWATTPWGAVHGGDHRG
jgi:hypothetical protein